MAPEVAVPSNAGKQAPHHAYRGSSQSAKADFAASGATSVAGRVQPPYLTPLPPTRDIAPRVVNVRPWSDNAGAQVRWCPCRWSVSVREGGLRSVRRDFSRWPRPTTIPDATAAQPPYLTPLPPTRDIAPRVVNVRRWSDNAGAHVRWCPCRWSVPVREGGLRSVRRDFSRWPRLC